MTIFVSFSFFSRSNN